MAPSGPSKPLGFEEGLPDFTVQLVPIGIVKVFQQQHIVPSLLMTCRTAMAVMPVASDTTYLFTTTESYSTSR